VNIPPKQFEPCLCYGVVPSSRHVVWCSRFGCETSGLLFLSSGVLLHILRPGPCIICKFCERNDPSIDGGWLALLLYLSPLLLVAPRRIAQYASETRAIQSVVIFVRLKHQLFSNTRLSGRCKGSMCGHAISLQFPLFGIVLVGIW
jgi:hypothetical protein